MQTTLLPKTLLPMILILLMTGCNLTRVPRSGLQQFPLAVKPTSTILSLLSTQSLPTAGPTSTQTAKAATAVPSATRTPLPTQPVKTAPTAAPTTQTSKPTTQAVKPTTAAIKPTQTTAPLLSLQGAFSVVLIDSGSELAAHASPTASSATVGKLAYNANNLTLTGKQVQFGGQTWVQVNLPGDNQGWVNRANLTEAVPSSTFCQDAQVDQLIANLTRSLKEKDSETFPGLISPIHGLALQLLRGGTLANYDLAKAAWVLESTYVVDWGKQPGSGQSLRGSFSKAVLPNLLDVLGGSYTKTCDKISLGGATYAATWPSAYENIHYLSLYRPAPAGKDQDWRTWVAGIEYVGGKPYLFSLNQFTWEP